MYAEMRKYDESTPTPTSYAHIKLKIGLVFSLLILPFIWYFSIQGILMDTPVTKISAKIIKTECTATGCYLDVLILGRLTTNRVTLNVRPEDFEGFATGQIVEIVGDSSVNRRYDYVLFEYAKTQRLIGKIMLWAGALFPLVLVVYVYLRRRRPRPKSPFRVETT